MTAGSGTRGRGRRAAADLRRGLKQARRSRLGLKRLVGTAGWRRRLPPAFLMLGAQKAGTTALFDWLCRCPGFAPPERFELHYFDNEFWRGTRWYLSHFPTRRAARGRITGEKSPYYLFHPAAPARVLATLPEARFLVLLRDPVARAYSHFSHAREHGFEPVASFREAIELEEERLRGEEKGLYEPAGRSSAHQHHSYLARGRYAEQLERWFALHPPSSFLVLQSERLFERPEEVLGEVFDFLGLQGERPPGFAPKNVGSYASLPPEAEERLRAYFEPHNERLSSLLGRRFDW